jgi:hypothetical protein
MPISFAGTLSPIMKDEEVMVENYPAGFFLHF